MALRYAVLGLLSKENKSGYDLAQTFAARVGHFWNAHHTQIYRELSKLETEGLVRHQVVEQQERPDKKIYELTEPGRTALYEWLFESPKPPKMKNEALLKVSLFHLIPPEHAMSFFRKSRDDHRTILGYMQALREEEFGDTPTREQVGEYLTLDFGIRFMRAWIDWCEDAERVMARFQTETAEEDH